MEKEPEPWDGTFPLAEFDSDKFFWCWDDIAEWCEDHECEPADLLLCPCKPDHGPIVDEANLFEDHLPEEGTLDDLPDAVVDGCKALSDLIREHGPYCWHADVSRRVRIEKESK